MLYAFGDESYPDGSSGRPATYLVIAALQDPFRSKAAELRDCFRTTAKRRQLELLAALRCLGASIVLGRAELPPHFDSVEAIEAPDIGRISPRAALWSWVFGFTCSVALHKMLSSGVVFSCADFFYDTNHLSKRHEEVTHKAMRHLLPQHLKEIATLRFGRNAPQPTLRHITPVPSWPKPYQPQHIQLGTSCAHEIQTFSLHSREEAESYGIEFRDFSDSIARICATGKLVGASTPKVNAFE